MHDHCVTWEKQYDYHFSVYSTPPAESLTDTFCALDTAKFGKIKDITAKEYYTNSFHYDVRKHPTPFEKLTFEEDYPKYASGGFIHYCEYPNLKQNPKALEDVWDWLMITWATSEPTLRLIIATNVASAVISNPRLAASNVQPVATVIRKPVMLSKEPVVI